MGMYCCCDQKIKDGWKCLCKWKNWVSVYNWPRGQERRNKYRPFSLPKKEGKYLVRISTQCGDRYETESEFSFKPRIVPCGYTGNPCICHWSGDDEEQPYAWKEIA